MILTVLIQTHFMTGIYVKTEANKLSCMPIFLSPLVFENLKNSLLSEFTVVLDCVLPSLKYIRC